VALTILLLAAGSAVAEGFLRLMRTPLGYDPRNTLVVGIPLRNNTYMSFERRAAFIDQLRARTAAIPGVLSAAISTRATPPTNGLDTRVAVALASPNGNSTTDGFQQARLSMVSPEYFSLLRIPLLSGRVWDQMENMRGSPVAVINETMARRYWPNNDPLGQSLRLPDLKGGPFRVIAPTANQPFVIVGVVADVRNDGLGQPVKPAIYLPYTIDMELFTMILIHTNVSLADTYNAVREQVRAVDSDQQVEGHGEIVSLESMVTRQEEWQQGHLATILLGAFALLALVLAGVGLYSVVSYGVAQRTKEFGIRIALGARSRDVLRLVLTSTGASVGVGVVAGVFLSFPAAKFVARLTQVTASSPLVLLNATLLFLAAASVACLAPARRASSIDPMEALRRE
jgi:putative ABC transport system permease protein